MKKINLIGAFLLLFTTSQSFASKTNIADGSPLVVLSTANADDPYYNPIGLKQANRYYDLIDFHATYAHILLESDVNVVIRCDKPTCQRLREQGIPNDILWRAGIDDIWMRDMSRAGLKKQAGFQFQPEYLGKREGMMIQQSFDDAVHAAGLKFPPRSKLVIDGGNIVDNFVDKVILTDRVLAENPDYTMAEIKAELIQQLAYKKVSIIPEIVDDTTGHVDGMVSFIDTNMLVYSDFDADTVDFSGIPIKKSMLKKLKKDFGNSVKLIPIPYTYPDNEGAFNFTSSCGTHVNALFTGDKLFVPVFGDDAENRADGLTIKQDKKVLQTIRKHTTAEVYEVPVPKRICEMGGSVRCLSWLLRGKNANQLINYVAKQSAKYK